MWFFLLPATLGREKSFSWMSISYFLSTPVLTLLPWEHGRLVRGRLGWMTTPALDSVWPHSPCWLVCSRFYQPGFLHPEAGTTQAERYFWGLPSSLSQSPAVYPHLSTDSQASWGSLSGILWHLFVTFFSGSLRYLFIGAQEMRVSDINGKIIKIHALL